MWNSLIQPGQRRSLERPANRDPLVIELQWNRDRHEPERDAADQGQARHVALTRRLYAQRPQQDAGDEAQHDRHDSDHPFEIGALERVAAGEERHHRGAERHSHGSRRSGRFGPTMRA